MGKIFFTVAMMGGWLYAIASFAGFFPALAN
jgi:hypothetical protein